MATGQPAQAGPGRLCGDLEAPGFLVSSGPAAQKVAGFHREDLELVATATAADVAVRLLRSKR